MSTTVSRRTKRHPIPPPPSPKILNFPRCRQTRRRKYPKPTTHLHPQINSLLLHQQYLSHKGRLEILFNQENEPPVVLLKSILDTSSVLEKRERVEEEDKELNFDENGGFEEEKWRFQVEILRAECNFLRIEREFALKKLEKNRVKMEKTLKSAVQTLGKKKIFEGKSVNKMVLEEEIENLVEKLEELQKSSKSKDSVFRNCSNFDEKDCVLQRRFEKLRGLSDHSFMNELQEIVPESNLSIDMSRDIDKQNNHSSSQIGYKSTDVDFMRKKMEGILDRVEVYGSMLSSTANSSVASSASNSKRIDQSSELNAFSTRQFYQEQLLHDQESKCSGRCKAIVRRIVEQVRAETEQWSQMQEMLGQVRGEMEELQVSRDFWENRAHNSDYEVQSLKQDVTDWKEKSFRFELKSNELKNELIVLKENVRKSKEDLPSATLRKQIHKEKFGSSCRFKEKREFDERRCKVQNAMEELNLEEIKERTRISETPPISLGKQLAKEKRMFLLGRFKENRCTSEVGCEEGNNKSETLTITGN